MDARSIVDQLLASGRELVEQGQDLAEMQLGIPGETESGEREAMLSGLGKGAVAGGLLALLLGTRGGRRLTGKLLKYGSLAALGTVAFQAYRQYQQDHQVAGETPPAIGDLTIEAARQRSLTILKAIVAAANADGHVDERERAVIQQQLGGMNLDDAAAQLIQRQLVEPIDVQTLAAEVDSPVAAVEVYLASRSIMNMDHPLESAYLRELATALRLPDDLVSRLEDQA